MIKKISVATLGFVMLVSTGTVFANMNSGENLTNWFTKSFQEEAEQISSESTNKMTTSLISFNESVHKSENEAQSSIQDSKEALVSEASTNIQEHKDKYVVQLEESVSVLKEQRYKEHVANATKKKVQETESDIEAILDEVLSENGKQN